MILFLLSVFSLTVFAQDKGGIALIYSGKGSCEVLPQPDGTILNELCSTAYKQIATRAGLRPVFVGPDALHADSSDTEIRKLFKGVKVWIQPGGSAEEISQVMSRALKKELKKFIASGGGYVGVGAGGGPFATNDLNIFPGVSSHPYESREETPGYFKKVVEGQRVIYSCSLELINWEGKPRRIYFQNDPYFTLNTHPGSAAVSIHATYPDGKIAAASSFYKKGRVFLSGVSPEAPLVWSEVDGLNDTDGLDHDLAIIMVKWAALK